LFFQAEDGIRDFHVTGVQTCALPICHALADEELDVLRIVMRVPDCEILSDAELEVAAAQTQHDSTIDGRRPDDPILELLSNHIRSEERRVGKEGRTRWCPYPEERRGE